MWPFKKREPVPILVEWNQKELVCCVDCQHKGRDRDFIGDYVYECNRDAVEERNPMTGARKTSRIKWRTINRHGTCPHFSRKDP